jgi:hypothetical protein
MIAIVRKEQLIKSSAVNALVIVELLYLGIMRLGQNVVNGLNNLDDALR